MIRLHFYPILLVLLLVALPCFAQSGTQEDPAAAPSEQVQVELASGRTFKAAVDAKTDEQTLWLRFDRTTAALYRPIQWERVIRVRYDGDDFEANEFRALVPQVSSKCAKVIRAPKAPRKKQSEEEVERPVRSHRPRSYADLASESLVSLPLVQSVIVDGYVADWDADTDVDGIIIKVAAIDAFGQSVPVSGTITFEMVSDRRSRLRPQPIRRRYYAQRFGYWAKNFRAESGGEQVFHLPFQAVHPEFDFALASQALVHVKLAVPGHGVYQTSITDLQIRPYSRIRNQLQDTFGRRFLSVERTGRGK